MNPPKFNKMQRYEKAYEIKFTAKPKPVFYGGFIVIFKEPLPEWQTEGIMALLKAIDQIAKVKKVKKL